MKQSISQETNKSNFSTMFCLLHLKSQTFPRKLPCFQKLSSFFFIYKPTHLSHDDFTKGGKITQVAFSLIFCRLNDWAG